MREAARSAPFLAPDDRQPGGETGRRWDLIALCAASFAVVGAVFAGPVPGPVGLLLTAVGCAMVALVVGSPTAAMLVLLLASFARLAIHVPALPSEPMVFALAGLMVSVVVAAIRGTMVFRLGPIEAVMIAYLAWNLLSVVLPHELPPVEPGNGQNVHVLRFIMSGTLMPFLAFVVARAAFRDERTIRPILWLVATLAAYSAAVSILQFTGPTALVWPRYIVDDPHWHDRAVGIFNQPVVNGLVMVAGFVTAMFLARERSLGRWPRLFAVAVAGACVPGIYLTHTRAVWLVFGLAVVMCAVFAARARAGFVVTLAGALGYILATWTTFTSSNRAAGGVGSTNEVEDRLNSIATSLWAIEHKPLVGWGIGRFAAVNTYYHQVWAPDVRFIRGYAISSHQNELGIAAELGLIGLLLWLAVLVGVTVKLLLVLRRLPVEGLAGRRLGLIALTVLATWFVCGLTVDLRYFNFANILVLLFVGAAVGAADGPTRHSERRKQDVATAHLDGRRAVLR